MPPTCLHGTKKFKMGDSNRGMYAAYFCPAGYRSGEKHPHDCVPNWDMELTKKRTMTHTKLPNGRLYNPGTGQYELVDPPKPVDPRAGAPAGIRVHPACQPGEVGMARWRGGSVSESGMSEEMLRAAAVSAATRLHAGSGLEVHFILDQAEKVAKWIRTGQK